MKLNKGNLKAQRSQAAIREAFLHILREKDFESITISEITDQAELSRRTYYRNYHAKIDIVDDILREMWIQFKEVLATTTYYTIHDVTILLYNVANRHKDTLLILHHQRLLYRIIDIAGSDLPMIIDEKRSDVFNQYQADPIGVQYISLFIISGYFQIIPKWLEENPDITPQEMGNYLQTMMRSYMAPQQ